MDRKAKNRWLRAGCIRGKSLSGKMGLPVWEDPMINPYIPNPEGIAPRYWISLEDALAMGRTERS